MAAEDLTPGADSIAVRPETQTSIKTEGSPNSDLNGKTDEVLG